MAQAAQTATPKTPPTLEQSFEFLKAYKSGDDSTVLIPIEAAVMAVQGNMANRAALERRLVAKLTPAYSYVARSFVCRQLALIGTPASVRALTPLVLEEELSVHARNALEHIPGAESEKALRDALGQAKGRTRIGVINSVAARRDAASTPVLIKILGEDPESAAAAAKWSPTRWARASRRSSTRTAAPPRRPTAQPAPCSASVTAPRRPRLVAARPAQPLESDEVPGGDRAQRLASLGSGLHRAAVGADSPRRARWLGPAPRPLGRRLRLRDRKARRLRPRGCARADLADAVAASCAIPGFYRPVEIAGRRYVDGGIRSTSNLDVLRGQGLDLVICLNPTSTLHPMRAAVNPSAAFRLMMNRESGRRLGSEAKKLRAEGTDVILIQPTRDDLAVMGNNLMSGARRNEAIAMARKTVAAQLRDPRHADLLASTPRGRAREGQAPRRAAVALAAPSGAARPRGPAHERRGERHAAGRLAIRARLSPRLRRYRRACGSGTRARRR